MEARKSLDLMGRFIDFVKFIRRSRFWLRRPRRHQWKRFWYNTSPRSGQDERSVPKKAVFMYEWRHLSIPSKTLGDKVGTASIEIGEEVWVKPSNTQCISRWGRSIVTDMQSQNNVSVGGMPRHVLDLRRVVDSSTDEEEPEEAGKDISYDGLREKH